MMENTLTAADITVIASLVAVIATVLSPLITEIVAQIGNYRMKSNELFFASKIAAYNDLLDVLSVADAHNPDDLHKLLSALSRAKMFAHPKAYAAITEYSEAWGEFFYVIKNHLPHHAERIRVGKSYNELLAELNKEILKMQKGRFFGRF